MSQLPPPPPSSRVRFGPFTFDLESRELWREGAAVPLAPRPGLILAELLQRPGTLVPRARLYEVGWGHTVVSFDLALNTAVRQIRRVLGEDGSEARYIQTVPRRGYRFVAAVTPVTQNDVATPTTRRRRRRASAAWLACASLLLAALWMLTRPPATVAVQPLRLLDASLDSASARIVEARMRAALAEAPLRGVQVLAPSYADAPATLVVQGTVHTGASGQPRLAVQIVRVRDGVIVWAGAFNPRCPRVDDPVGFIARYVTEVLPRVT